MLKIITDSAADVPKNEAEQYDIRVMGIPITVDGVSYRESVDFTSEEYYGMLTAAKAIPTTAQITLMEFADAFREEIAAGDIIAFQSGDSIITHRVVENHVVEGTFTTKGDANAQKDMEDVLYGQLSGRVARHYPLIGGVMTLYTSKIGKAYVICFAACGAMFNILAGRIRARRKEKLAGSQQAP